MRTSINYLEKAQHVQELVKKQQERYIYITLKQIWKNLRKEKQYFEGYDSFIRILGEGNLRSRIEQEKEKQNPGNQTTLTFDQ
ncbi:MAG: hypothetical protein FWC34_09120 [Bacteroidetes bacterium]|nr:hypothetical protein [Bacteroidota bacterium]